MGKWGMDGQKFSAILCYVDQPQKAREKWLQNEKLWRVAINNTKVWKSMELAGASSPTIWKDSKRSVIGRG